MLEPIRAKVQCIQAAVGKFSDKYLHKVYWTDYQIQLAGRLMVERQNDSPLCRLGGYLR